MAGSRHSAKRLLTGSTIGNVHDVDEAAIRANIGSWWNGLDDETKLQWCDAYLHGTPDELARTLPKTNREVSPDTWIWQSARGWVMTKPMREAISTFGSTLISERNEYWTGQLVRRVHQAAGHDAAPDIS
jgi:hypothetical protein